MSAQRDEFSIETPQYTFYSPNSRSLSSISRKDCYKAKKPKPKPDKSESKNPFPFIIFIPGFFFGGSYLQIYNIFNRNQSLREAFPFPELPTIPIQPSLMSRAGERFMSF